MTDAVRLEQRDQVLEVTLNRPKANAIDPATSRALAEAFIAFRDDPALRAAIVTGAGERFFSAGWDLKAAAAGEGLDADYGPSGFAGLTEVFDLNKPVIAAVNGMAVGGGFELVLACDLVVTAEHAEFFLPELSIGLIPDGGGVLRLPRRLPRAVATEMMMTGRRMPAAEAARWGLINRVVPAAELMAAARELADQIVKDAPLALAALKEVMRSTEGLSIEESYRKMRSDDCVAYQQMLASEDIVEGPRAFAEKREPVWQGK